MIEDAPLLTKTVKINQSEGIPGSGYRNALLLKIPLSERLEQAKIRFWIRRKEHTLGVSDIFRKLRMCVDHVFKAEHSMASFSPPDTVHIWPVFSLGPSAICFVS